jgi:hypothetical protein
MLSPAFDTDSEALSAARAAATAATSSQERGSGTDRSRERVFGTNTVDERRAKS